MVLGVPTLSILGYFCPSLELSQIFIWSTENKQNSSPIYRQVQTCSEDNSGIIFQRALDKRGYLMIIEDKFSYFSMKPYVVTPYLNRLVETVQMRGHIICF